MIRLESPVVRSAHVLEEPVSSSRLNCFHSCRLKFFFRYVEGLRKPTSAALYVGSSVHRALLQLTVYGVLYEEAAGAKARGFELHHLVKTKVPKLVVTQHPAIGEREKLRLFRSIESYLAGVEREDWVASLGLQCASCEYFQLCPGGLP